MQIVQRIYTRNSAYPNGERPRKGAVIVPAFDGKARHLQNCILETLAKEGNTYCFQRTTIGLADAQGRQITGGLVSPGRSFGENGFPTFGINAVPHGSYTFKSVEQLRKQTPSGKGARQHQSAIMSIESAMRQLKRKPKKTFPGVTFLHPTGKIHIGKGSRWQPKMLVASDKELADIADFTKVSPRNIHLEIPEDLRYWTRYDPAVVDSWSDGLLSIQHIKASLAHANDHSEATNKTVSA